MSNWPTAFEPVDSGSIDSFEVGELLASLTDKSLIVLDQESGRYRLLETVRDYARIQLASLGEVDESRSRHRDFFLALSEEAAYRLAGSEQAEWLDRLEKEHENLRASLEWNFEEEIAETRLRMSGALASYWWTRGHFSEGRFWCERALGDTGGPGRTRERANALNGAGVLSWYQGDYDSARTYHEESLIIRREIGDSTRIPYSLNCLAGVAHDQGDYASARTNFEESLSLFREIGDRRGIAQSLNGLGGLAYYQGDYDLVRTYFEESLSLFREIGDPRGIGQSLINLGIVAHDQADYDSARTYHEESLRIRREIGDRRGIAYSLSNLGCVACSQDDYASARTYQVESLCMHRDIGDRRGIAYSLEALANLMAGLQRGDSAARLWGAAEALRKAIGAPLQPNERKEYDRQVASACDTFAEDVFSQAWAEGRAMTLEQAIEYALEEIGV